MSYSIVKVPISFMDGVYGESKSRNNEIMKYGKGLLRLWDNV